LRYKLAKARRGPEVLELLQQSPVAEVPEFGKAMQRCGEMRDYDALLAVRQLLQERNVCLNMEGYGILLTAVARTTRGANGRSIDGRFCTRASALGKAAYEEMRRRPDFVPMLPPYGAALGLCARIGDADWAGEIWSEMLAKCLRPSIVEYTQYLSAVLSRGGEADWQSVEAEMQAMRQNHVSPDAAFLGALIDSAGKQYSLQRVEWLWQELAPQVPRLSTTTYGCTAKAFMLCGVPERVPPLRDDMLAREVPVMFRNLQFEAQARLLLLHGSPSSEAGSAFRAAAALAHEERDRNGAAAVSRSEVSDLQLMEKVAGLLVQGRRVPLCDARVMNWPWPPEVCEDRPLPAGWGAALDPASGRRYYWREADPAGSTTWELPA